MAFTDVMNRANDEIVKWRRNLFDVPRGKAGMLFVREMQRLIDAYNHATTMEGIALKAAMVLPALVLQRSHAKSKSKDHSTRLVDRMRRWAEGDFESLLHEGQTTQSRLPRNERKRDDDGKLARSVEKLVAVGNVRAATRLITQEGDSGCLPLDSIQPDGRSVRDHLADKHPPSSPANPSAISKLPPVTDPHQVVFDRIDGPMVRATIQLMSGSAGPSGLDARAWRRLCSSFHRASDDLCESIANLTRRLCTTYVEPSGIAPLIASRLVALDKCPGIRPIGVGEILRRLIGKLILKIAHNDILDTTGTLQLCVGQEAACESSVHAMRQIFADANTEAVLLVDASNAFNTLNRQAALKNAHILCPILAPVLTSMYRGNAKLFIGGEHILSQEGTTQGDPLAMAMYAIGTLPLIHQLQGDVLQSWYADDAAAGGRLRPLSSWWHKLKTVGPCYGYHPNPSKTWLVVKSEHLEAAKELFEGTGINVTEGGRMYLGAVVGARAAVEEFVREKVADWVKDVENLSVIAEFQPQAAYAVFTHSLVSSWNYIMRTIPSIDSLLQPLEDAIRHVFLPALIGRQSFSDEERELFALPARLGGLGIAIPTKCAQRQFSSSSKLSDPLVSLIHEGIHSYLEAARAEQRQVKAALRSQNRTSAKEEADDLKQRLPRPQQLSMEQTSERGASSWLTTIPVAEHGFTLHKQDFRDALCLRYGWRPSRLPSHCLCGEVFSVGHALSCPKGAFPSIRHNRIRDLFARFLTEVCPNVSIEPALQPLSGEAFSHRSANVEDAARLDVKAQNFWGSNRESAFFDIRVFNSYAPSNCKLSSAACYRKHELEKRRAYERRIIEVEHGSFTPIVLSTSGGWGPAATVAFKRLASLLSDKLVQPYSRTLGFLRCKIAFSLLDSAIMCLRGARSSFHSPAHNNADVQDQPLDLIAREARLSD